MNKTGRLIVISILMLAIFVSVFVILSEGKKNQDNSIATVTGTAQGFKGEVTASLRMKDGKIIELNVIGLDETPEIGGEAIKTLTKEILEKGGTNGVDSITGATYTSKAVFNAISDALSKAQ